MKLTLVGAGRMGLPIARKLAAAGHELSVLVRRSEARAALQAEGLRCDATTSDADLVFVVVHNDAQVREVCLDHVIPALKRGAVVVQHTTCNPATLELLGSAASERGAHVLDAALSGGPHDVAAGTLTLWLGGERELCSELSPLLRSYASPILWVGPLGAGQRIKLVNNALFIAQLGLAADALRLATEFGLEQPVVLEALRHGSAASKAWEVLARGGLEGLAPRVGELMRKDLAVVREIAQGELGLLGTVLDSDAVNTHVLGAR